jgi:hypothetical protein
MSTPQLAFFSSRQGSARVVSTTPLAVTLATPLGTFNASDNALDASDESGMMANQA